MPRETKFPAQRGEIQDLLRRSNLSLAAMAERVGLKFETLEKYAEGWQMCGKAVLIAIHWAANFELERLARAAGEPLPADSLHEETVTYASKLLRLPNDKRDLVKRMIDELDANANSDAGAKTSSVVGKALASAQSEGAPQPPVTYPRPGAGSRAARSQPGSKSRSRKRSL